MLVGFQRILPFGNQCNVHHNNKVDRVIKIATQWRRPFSTSEVNFKSKRLSLAFCSVDKMLACAVSLVNILLLKKML